VEAPVPNSTLPLEFCGQTGYSVLAFRTAKKKHIAVRGMVIARMIPVLRLPRSGSPEVSSNTEPTAAIALMQEPARNKPLIGVNVPIFHAP